MTRQIHIPDSFDTSDGGEISFGEIHHRFADSHFGRHLRDQVRYSRFKPDWVSNKDWCRAPLGADVNNLEHMSLTRGLAREYLKHQKPEDALNSSDSQILMLASETHDWAEAITDDIMFDKKSPSEDADEATMMLFLLKKTLGAKLSAETLMQVYKTVKDRTTRLGEIFNAIERVGYMRSGLNAWTASEKPRGEVLGGPRRKIEAEVEDELREAFQWMASNVVGNQTVALLKYAKKYHPVEKYMSEVRMRIDRLFLSMPVAVFAKYADPENENEQLQQIQKFMAARTAWKNSKYKIGDSAEDSVDKDGQGGL